MHHQPSTNSLGTRALAIMASKPFSVTVHPYPSKVKHACAYELGSSQARNALIFVGGLGDGPHTVPYIRTVAAKIEADTGLSYSVFEIRTRSSFCGFGWNNLSRDVQDISSLVKYLRGIGKEKVVLMGHSTGSQVCVNRRRLTSHLTHHRQDCIEYTDYEKHQNEPVDGFILQGSVSDREGFSVDLGKDEAEKMVAVAAEMINDGRKDDAVPKSKLSRPPFPWPVTAYRLHSLASVG